MQTVGRLGVLTLAVAALVGVAAKAPLRLTSPAFAHGRPIPAKFTCAGANLSPELHWTGVPTGTKSFALICEDPDAPGGQWVHWIIYHLPGAKTGLAAGIATTESLPEGMLQGLNGFRKIGYRGPCPPAGETHRYFFKLYAVDTELALKPGVNRAELLHALQGHVLAEAELMGTVEAK